MTQVWTLFPASPSSLVKDLQNYAMYMYFHFVSQIAVALARTELGINVHNSEIVYK